MAAIGLVLLALGLRALLLGGDDSDRELARGTLTDTRLAGLARRRLPRDASREQAVRHAEIRRLALALREAARALKANRAQLQTIVNDLVPGLIERRGIGPVSAAQAIVSFSHPGRCRNDAAFAALGGASPLPASPEAVAGELQEEVQKLATKSSEPGSAGQVPDIVAERSEVPDVVGKTLQLQRDVFHDVPGLGALEESVDAALHPLGQLTAVGVTAVKAAPRQGLDSLTGQSAIGPNG